MEVNAGKILRLEARVDEVGEGIYRKVLEVASGMQSCSESLGHQEFVLTYKSFEPGRPAYVGCEERDYVSNISRFPQSPEWRHLCGGLQKTSYSRSVGSLNSTVNLILP
jgi:hypothetical protein